MNEKCQRSDTQQIHAGGPLRLWARLLRTHGGIDRCFLRRAAFVWLTCAITFPVRLAERAIYGRRIRATPITSPPIFILGHWRSGTTFLHNLVSRDSQFGTISCLQIAAPDAYLLSDRVLRVLLTRFVKPTRPMDDVPMPVDSPQEEEFSMAKVSPHSFYHAWTFPRQSQYYFDKYVLFRDLLPAERTEWEDAYMGILKKATMSAGGKPLLLKSPVNMGRIGAILKLFPDARFIHVYRNPYAVFASARHLHQRALQLFQVQSTDDTSIEANVLRQYRKLMSAFLADRKLIPEGNLVELKFEDLRAAPLRELHRI